MSEGKKKVVKKAVPVPTKPVEVEKKVAAPKVKPVKKTV
jgi:hypothetical protein